MQLTDLAPWGESLRIAVEVIGTIAFALSGILAGVRKRMDMFGVAVLGFLSAYGGGTLRDILLERRPFFWVSQELMLWLVFALCIVVMLVNSRRPFRITPAAIQLAVYSSLAAWVIMFISTVTTTGLRIAALAFNYRLPGWKKSPS